MDRIIKALPVSVYRNGRVDCTNNGVSSRYDELLVVCTDGFVDVDLNNKPENLVVVRKRRMFGQNVYHLEPFFEPKGAGWMMGGNYAASSDSRFSKLIGEMYGAVAIHDRQESWEEYEMYSR